MDTFTIVLIAVIISSSISGLVFNHSGFQSGYLTALEEMLDDQEKRSYRDDDNHEDFKD
jgi:hypothetical protein